MTKASPLLEMRDVCKTYLAGKMSVQALRDVTLTIRRGEFLSLHGPSGSGKTTLLNLAGCLDRATSGSIRLDGREVGGLSTHMLASVRQQKLGFIFQSYNLIPVLSAVENVELPLLFHRSLSGQARRKRARSILTEVGLGDLLLRRPAELSGGQQQRVAVARALVKEPLLVLADEPTANLDSDTGRRLMELMRKLNAEKQVTFLFSTHDEMVMRFARRLVRLRDGRIDQDRIQEEAAAK